MTRTIVGVAVLLSIVVVVLTARQGRSAFQARQRAPALVPQAARDAIIRSAQAGLAEAAGGGCGGGQGVFQHTRGGIGAVSGYAGGDQRTAAYALVRTGTTGHAEAVQV